MDLFIVDMDNMIYFNLFHFNVIFKLRRQKIVVSGTNSYHVSRNIAQPSHTKNNNVNDSRENIILVDKNFFFTSSQHHNNNNTKKRPIRIQLNPGMYLAKAI